MPVLARTLEAAGFCTLLVTNMPFWLQWLPVPRALAIEYPFAHLFGQPGECAGQQRVLRQALAVLAHAGSPGTLVHSPDIWPVPVEEATRAWQPLVTSPVVQLMAPHLRELLALRRRRA